MARKTTKIQAVKVFTRIIDRKGRILMMFQGKDGEAYETEFFFDANHTEMIKEAISRMNPVRHRKNQIEVFKELPPEMTRWN